MISSNPHHRLGVYKTLEDVPPHNRLRNYSEAFEDRDLWGEYVEQELHSAADSVKYETSIVKKSWKSHMETRGRQPAFARPADVESWVTELLEEIGSKRAYNPYWVRIEDFFSYLMWHTQFPHVYHPPLMAANADGAIAQIWELKIQITIND